MSRGDIRLSVVIPAYNEADRLGQTLDRLLTELPSFGFPCEIRVVDDGSVDETADVVRRLGRADDRIVLQREPHQGKGGALKSGLLAARGALRFMCDADLSMPPHEIHRFVSLVPGDCDIAIGSREAPGARRIDEPVYRHVLGRGFNALARYGLLPGLQDTQCGFKLFTARAIEAVLPATTVQGWTFDLEVLFVATLQGWRIREVPIEWHYDARSHVSVLRDPWRMIRDLWRIRANGRRGVYARRQPERARGVARDRGRERVMCTGKPIR
jgi:glycosyltransferase involved in cell wall biosynthesis